MSLTPSTKAAKAAKAAANAKFFCAMPKPAFAAACSQSTDLATLATQLSAQVLLGDSLTLQQDFSCPSQIFSDLLSLIPFIW